MRRLDRTLPGPFAWLALLVLAVCGKLALDLFLTPDDFYAIQPGIG